MARKVLVMVEAEIPDGVTPGMFAYHVEMNAKVGVGAYSPDDALFDIERDKIRAVVVPRRVDWMANILNKGEQSPIFRRWFGK